MRLARFMIFATVMSATTALSALAAPFAYVSNEGSASVSVIDTATDKNIDVLASGKPRGIALSLIGGISERPDLRPYSSTPQRRPAQADGAKQLRGIYLSTDGRLLSAAVESDQIMLVDAADRAATEDAKSRCGLQRMDAGCTSAAKPTASISSMLPRAKWSSR